MEVISNELEYKPKVSNHSTILYRQVSPQQAGTINLVSSAPSGLSEFIISPSVWNPSKSKLNFTIYCGDVVNNYNYINANLLTAISRVVLYDSATNAVWCDCSNFEKYASLMTPLGTHIDDFITKDTGGGASATTTLKYSDDIVKSFIDTNNASQSDNTSVNLYTNNPFLSRRQYYIGAVGTGGTAGNLYVRASVPLSAFKFTALALDKQMYAPSNLVLQIYWNRTDNFAFQTTSATNPASGLSVAVATISEISLTLANEGNLAITSQVINKVMSEGLQLAIPYPTTTRQSISSSSAHSYNLQLTRGYGNRILFLATAPFSAGTPLGTQYPNLYNAHTPVNISTINTFINNVALKSQSGFDVVKGEDLSIANKKLINKCAIQTLSDYYNSDYVFIDSFVGERPLCEIDTTEIDGLDVGTQSSTWQIQTTLSSATAYNYITAIVGQKTLSISNQGSMVM